MKKYVGLLDGGGDVWGVVIPDLPGIHGGGATPDAAIADAISAFREVVRIRAEDGDVWIVPPPRSLAEVLTDPEVQEDIRFSGATTVMVLLPADVNQRHEQSS